MLDVAGPLQTFYEANACGANYSITISATAPRVDTAQLLTMSHLSALPHVAANDLVVVPGFDVQRRSLPPELIAWLRQAAAAGAHTCAVCTGAFALGQAGLLDERNCTTHWKRVDQLQRRFPAARVLRDRLFVTDGPVTTSAGVASGIDMALSLVEQRYGPLLTAHAAREMVVHLRRDGSQKQDSVYLDYRTHFNSGVHRVQDYVIAHAEEKMRIPELAKIAHMSPRSLTRAFRTMTKLSIAEYRNKIRLETAKLLLHDPNVTMEAIAHRTGFNESRHFRRTWKKTFGVSPSTSRKRRA